MYKKNYSRNWSSDYVKAHENSCIDTISESMAFAKEYIRKKDYSSAAEEFQNIVSGLELLTEVNTKQYIFLLYSNCYSLSRIYAFGLRDYESARLFTAKACEYARSAITYGGSAQSDFNSMSEVLTDFDAHRPLSEIEEDFGYDFPFGILSDSSFADDEYSQSFAKAGKRNTHKKSLRSSYSGLVAVVLAGIILIIIIVSIFTLSKKNTVAPPVENSSQQPTASDISSTESVQTESKVETIKFIKTKDPNGKLNLRKEPLTDKDNIIAVMPNKSSVTVIKTEGDWALVKYDGIEGWCSANYLSASYDQ